MEKMWRCAVCAGDSRSYSNGVQWEFAPVKHSERRVLAHLLEFHDISPLDLKSARLVESDYSGGLSIGSRVLAMWSRSDATGDDMHRSGNWLSDVVRHQPKPQGRPPY